MKFILKKKDKEKEVTGFAPIGLLEDDIIVIQCEERVHHKLCLSKKENRSADLKIDIRDEPYCLFVWNYIPLGSHVIAEYCLKNNIIYLSIDNIRLKLYFKESSKFSSSSSSDL